jgi:spermidine synthase
VHTRVDNESLALSAIILIAWCSGFASLIYQINWQRQLTTVFGLAHYATTLTILAFFVGFALGAYFIKRYSHRLQKILVVIAGLEVIIGTFGVLSFDAFDLLRNLNGAVSLILADANTVLLSTRMALCLFFLLVPTVCMGATLPCFFSACIYSSESRGQRIGWITGANTLGALAGSVCTTWILMGLLHGQTQMFIAAALNLFGAAIALLLHASNVPSPIAQRTTSVHREAKTSAKPNSLSCAFMLSGAASLGLQILWNRLAYISLEHTIFTFALVLSVFLTAYAAGAFCSGLWLRKNIARRSTAALLQLSAMSCTLIGFLFFAEGLQSETLSQVVPYQLSALVVVCMYTFLPMFFIGWSTPIVLDLLSGSEKTLVYDTSRAMMMNNAGSILAILIVGFILIPAFNLYAVILFCSLLLTGSAILTAGFPRAKIQTQIYYPLAALAVTGLFSLVPIDPYGVRHFKLYGEYPRLSAEDESGYWAVSRKSSPKGEMHYLYLNDMYENYLQNPDYGTIEGDFLLAAMIKPEIQSAYSIGLGLALEPYELLRFPELEQFTTAEISPASLDLAQKIWSEYESTPFDDPRFEVVIEDGRIWLEHQTKSFDLIFSGTNRSFYPGSTNLFSVEYLQMLKGTLNPGGVVQQWIPRYPDHQSVVLIKTFLSVFPDGLLVAYRDPSRRVAYYYMLGFGDGTPFDLTTQIENAFRRAPEIFSTAAISTPEEFLATLKIPRRAILAELDTPLVYDDLPVVEYDRSAKKLGVWVDMNKFTQDYSPARLKQYLQPTPMAEQW